MYERQRDAENRAKTLAKKVRGIVRCYKKDRALKAEYSYATAL